MADISLVGRQRSHSDVRPDGQAVERTSQAKGSGDLRGVWGQPKPWVFSLPAPEPHPGKSLNCLWLALSQSVGSFLEKKVSG